MVQEVAGSSPVFYPYFSPADFSRGFLFFGLWCPEFFVKLLLGSAVEQETEEVNRKELIA